MRMERSKESREILSCLVQGCRRIEVVPFSVITEMLNIVEHEVYGPWILAM